MKISDYKKDYEEFSGTLSGIVRNLSFMGFGIVWILIGGLDGFKKGVIPQQLLWVLVFLVGFIILDIVHYIYQTIIWYCYFKKLEKEHGATCDRDNFLAPKKYTRWGWFIFWLKIAVIITAYILLLFYMFKLIF